jgi:hypothetical protein
VARPAPRATELAFVGLSFVDVPPDAPPAARAASLGPESCGGRDVQAWVQATLPDEARAWFAADAELVGAATREERVAHGLSWFALVTDDELGRLRTRPLAELGAEGPTLRTLGGLGSPAAEIFWADLGLSLEPFTPVFDRDLAPRLTRWAAEFDRLVAGLSLRADWLRWEETELSVALGAPGRVLGERVVVGLGDPAHPDVARAASKSLHEHAVRACARALERRGEPAAWAQVEAVALELGRRVVAGTDLERDHLLWWTSVDRSGLEAPDAIEEVLAALASDPAPLGGPGAPRGRAAEG